VNSPYSLAPCTQLVVKAVKEVLSQISPAARQPSIIQCNSSAPGSASSRLAMAARRSGTALAYPRESRVANPSSRVPVAVARSGGRGLLRTALRSSSAEADQEAVGWTAGFCPKDLPENATLRPGQRVEPVRERGQYLVGTGKPDG
jgi:hypothetical protein